MLGRSTSSTVEWQSALNANGLQVPIGIEATGHTDDGVKFEKKNGYRRIVEVYLAASNLFDQPGGQRVNIQFQAQCQSLVRRELGHGFAEPECIAPKGLVPECVETKGLFAFRQNPLCVLADGSLCAPFSPFGGAAVEKNSNVRNTAKTMLIPSAAMRLWRFEDRNKTNAF